MNSIMAALAARIFAIGACLLLCVACAKSKEQDGNPSASVSGGTGLPADVDPQLLRRIRELAASCGIDLRDSEVHCNNGGLQALSEQFAQGARSRSKSLGTLVFALSQPDEKVYTVAAELLYLAFRSPIEEKGRKPTSKKTAQALIDALGKLPAQQASDAAPAATYAAFETGLDKEYFAAVEAHSYSRLASKAYRYLLAAGGMRAWGKVMELARSPQLETVLAALEAPSLMREKTQGQRSQICDWYKSLIEDERSVVASRASGYLIVCGPTYIEQLLVEDEERLKDKTANTISIGSYSQMCRGMVAASGPTPEQCARLRTLLTAVLEDTRFEPLTRVSAIRLLTVNFVDRNMQRTLQKYARDKQPKIAQTADESAKQIEKELSASTKQTTAKHEAPSARASSGVTSTGINPAGSKVPQ